jgi:hypothetical protein
MLQIAPCSFKLEAFLIKIDRRSLFIYTLWILAAFPSVVFPTATSGHLGARVDKDYRQQCGLTGSVCSASMMPILYISSEYMRYVVQEHRSW